MSYAPWFLEFPHYVNAELNWLWAQFDVQHAVFQWGRIKIRDVGVQIHELYAD